VTRGLSKRVTAHPLTYLVSENGCLTARAHKKTDGPRFTGARRLREERLLCCFLPA